LAKRGKTIIMASHVLADVQDVCSRVAILCNGRIQIQGRVPEILNGQSTLEELFLAVVTKAQAESGGLAITGGSIPAYLSRQ